MFFITKDDLLTNPGKVLAGILQSIRQDELRYYQEMVREKESYIKGTSILLGVCMRFFG